MLLLQVRNTSILRGSSGAAPPQKCKEIVIICIKQDVEILSNSSFFFCKSRTSKIRYLGNDQQATASSDVRLTQTSLCLMTATSHCCLKCKKIRCTNNQPPIDLPPKKSVKITPGEPQITWDIETLERMITLPKILRAARRWCKHQCTDSPGPGREENAKYNSICCCSCCCLALSRAKYIF